MLGSPRFSSLLKGEDDDQASDSDMTGKKNQLCWESAKGEGKGALDKHLANVLKVVSENPRK